jgi:hypothetical protein
LINVSAIKYLSNLELKYGLKIERKKEKDKCGVAACMQWKQLLPIYFCSYIFPKMKDKN